MVSRTKQLLRLIESSNYVLKCKRKQVNSNFHTHPQLTHAVSNRTVNAHNDMYASNRSINDSRGGAKEMSYTEQLAASLDPVNNMLHSADR